MSVERNFETENETNKNNGFKYQVLTRQNGRLVLKQQQKQQKQRIKLSCPNEAEDLMFKKNIRCFFSRSFNPKTFYNHEYQHQTESMEMDAQPLVLQFAGDRGAQVSDLAIAHKELNHPTYVKIY